MTLRIAPTLCGAALAVLFMANPASGEPGGHNRFRATIPDGAEGEAGELRTPLEFEEEAADNPQAGAQILFSRCRAAPFFGDTSLYPPLAAPEYDAIVDDTLFYFADGTSCYNPQNEQNIVINPTDSTNVATSANEYRDNVHAVYYSNDGGQSWGNRFLPGWTRSSAGRGVFGHLDSCGDPVLAYAPDGTLYYAGLVCNFDKFPRTLSGIAVAASRDGGATWSAPTMVDYRAAGNFFADKEWIGVGPDGTVYVTWTRFYQGPQGLGYQRSPILMSSSRNGGKSWSAPKEVSDAAHLYNQGSQVAVAPNGVVYVAYEGADPDTGYNTDQLVVARSDNGGKSFTTKQLARVYDDLDCYPIQLPGGQNRQTLTNEQFRINSYPSMAIDPSSGKIAIVWADNEGSGTCGQGGAAFDGTTSNQVKLVQSANGKNWSAPAKLTTDAPDKVYPSVGADAGRVVVGYYTRAYSLSPNLDPDCGIMELDTQTLQPVKPIDPQRASAAVCLDWEVRSSDDGFAAPTRVTHQSSNPYTLFAGSFIGDYTGTAVDAAGHAITVWTDFRGDPQVTSPNQDVVVGLLNPAP